MALDGQYDHCFGSIDVVDLLMTGPHYLWLDRNRYPAAF